MCERELNLPSNDLRFSLKKKMPTGPLLALGRPRGICDHCCRLVSLSRSGLPLHVLCLCRRRVLPPSDDPVPPNFSMEEGPGFEG